MLELDLFAVCLQLCVSLKDCEARGNGFFLYHRYPQIRRSLSVLFNNDKPLFFGCF